MHHLSIRSLIFSAIYKTDKLNNVKTTQIKLMIYILGRLDS